MNPLNIPFGRYVLTERLAAGTVADIFRATTRTADGQSLVVVIKRIREDLSRDPQFSGAFIDEARIAASLDHPNIVKVYEWSRQDDTLFIAMEYIEGTNLASLMQSCSEQGLRIPPTLAIHVVCELLAGLDYAHRLKDAYGHPLGIVHRAVAPQNVVISSGGQVKLVDFGVARASTRVQSTRPGLFSQQRTYLAPEVSGQMAVDGRADVFSCGVILYELITGRKLHADSDRDGRAAAEQMRSRPPSSLLADIPADLDDLVLKAASLAADERFESAGQMKQQLEAFLARWDRQLDPDALSAFLVEALSGRSAGKPQGGFAFGEATSHWFAQGEELVRVEPAPTGDLEPAAEPVAAASEEPAPALVAPPAGSFSAGSTVMAVEQSGLGRRRHLKTLFIMLGILFLLALLVALIMTSLSSKPAPAEKTAQPASTESEGFAGAVQVQSVPQDAAVFVDGDLVERQGQPPRLLNLRAGQRRFKLVAPGYLPWEQDVVLERGQPKTIQASLEPRQGTLVVRSSPPRALLFLDGKRIGRTPVKVPDLSAAQAHKAVLRARRRQPLKFEIRPGDWPEDPAAELVIEKKLARPARGRVRHRRRR